MIFTKGLAKQSAKKGIRVNTVAPGSFWTPLQVTGGNHQESCRNLARTRRWAVQASMQNLQVSTILLASTESGYATGQVFGAAGGYGGP
ncbi:MAG: SDR family oxidoreductase [Burkholderiales bacterium]|nr:SDR family oxidoreductase [Burkholderiales bacterium]